MMSVPVRKYQTKETIQISAKKSLSLCHYSYVTINMQDAIREFFNKWEVRI